MTRFLTYRISMLAVFAISAGLLGYAYYSQFVLYLDPCPLCILQRVAFIIMALLALVAAIHNPGRTGRWGYSVLILAGAGWGVATAGRHLYIHHAAQAGEMVPSCGAGLGYMIEEHSLPNAIQMAFTGGGDCTLVDWTFLGLSMPAWTLVWYLLLAGFTLWATIRNA